jgi:hypothetical protein
MAHMIRNSFASRSFVYPSVLRVPYLSDGADGAGRRSSSTPTEGHQTRQNKRHNEGGCTKGRER